jgi:hypothetical protein
MPIRAKEGSYWDNFVYLRHLSKGAVLRVGSRLKIRDPKSRGRDATGTLVHEESRDIPQNVENRECFCRC